MINHAHVPPLLLAPPVAAACILCGRPTMRRGVWIPDEPAREGLGSPPPGTQRVVLYAVCDAHDIRKRITLVLVEQTIKEQMARP